MPVAKMQISAILVVSSHKKRGKITYARCCHWANTLRLLSKRD
jgi:hypothetical protein